MRVATFFQQSLSFLPPFASFPFQLAPKIDNLEQANEVVQRVKASDTDPRPGSMLECATCIYCLLIKCRLYFDT